MKKFTLILFIAIIGVATIFAQTPQAFKYQTLVRNSLGDLITKKGNHVHGLVKTDGGRGFAICSYPVKPVFQECKADKSNVVKHMQSKMRPGASVPGWACVATMKETTRSAEELVTFAYAQGWRDVVIPRPAVGAGELNWADVMPAIVIAMNKEVGRVIRNYILNVYSITFPPRSK